jgi:protein TonB
MTSRAIVLLEREDGAEVARWALAAAIVLAAHLGLMATYLLYFSQQPQGAPTPIIIDMVPMPVAPASPVDLAPGPEMMEVEPPPEPQVVEPLPPEPLIEPPLPVVEPLITLPEPPKEPPPPPEVKEEPKPKPPQVKRVERKKPAPRTTAAPRSERTADAQSAPSPGSVSASAAMASWRDLVVAQLQRAKRYPSGAESRREQGVVTLSFTVSRSGSVLGRSIARSSGNSELDQEVLAMVARASPFPQFPPGMNQASVHLTVPVRFSLR